MIVCREYDAAEYNSKEESGVKPTVLDEERFDNYMELVAELMRSADDHYAISVMSGFFYSDTVIVDNGPTLTDVYTLEN